MLDILYMPDTKAKDFVKINSNSQNNSEANIPILQMRKQKMKPRFRSRRFLRLKCSPFFLSSC